MVISNSGKSLNKFGVVEEIGCENDLVLSKISKEMNLGGLKTKKSVAMEGWVGGCIDGCKSHFKDCEQQSNYSFKET